MLANPNLIYRQPGGQMTVDRFGAANARETYRGFYSVLSTQGPAIDSPHPDFPALLVSKKILQRDRSGLGTLFVEYAGLDPANPETLPAPVYELDRSTGSEPIDSHPFWDDIVAAAGGYAPEKVVTDENGVFIAFGKNATGGLRGTQSYLNPQTTWTKTYVTNTQPSAVGNVGKIDTPEGGAPSLDGDRNWLNLGLRFTKEGGIYRAQQTWMASGPGGWNTHVYDYA